MFINRSRHSCIIRIGSDRDVVWSVNVREAGRAGKGAIRSGKVVVHRRIQAEEQDLVDPMDTFWLYGGWSYISNWRRRGDDGKEDVCEVGKKRG